MKDDRKLRRIETVFGWLVSLYPAEFRRLLGSDMRVEFARRADHLLAERGRPRAYAFALRTFVGVLLGVTVEHARGYRRRKKNDLPGRARAPREGKMSQWIQDLGYGVRLLGKSKAFGAIAIATLALGIGVNTTIFSLISTLFFAELPVKDPDGFVFLWAVNERAGENRTSLSLPEVADLREGVEAFEGVCLAVDESFLLTGEGDEPRRVAAFRVTDNFLSVWGVDIALGRGFLPGEDRPGAEPVALLSHGFWERKYASDPRVVGSTIRLDGRAVTVVGIVSKTMEFGDISNIDVWVPLGLALQDQRRDNRRAFTQARLRPGRTPAEAQAEATALAERLAAAHPESEGWGFRVSTVSEEILNPDDRTLSLVIVIAVAFVLLIACANVANMIMARSAGRTREISVRLALGASRGRILAQFLTEALLLSFGGAVVGLLLARGLLDLLVYITSEHHWIYRMAKIDVHVLLFTFAISVVTPLFFGLVPALRASRPDLVTSLREGARAGTARGALRSRGLLATAQVAMALSLMIVTALLTHRVAEMKTSDLGFAPENLLALSLSLPSDYASDEKIRRFYGALLTRARETPGVQEASLGHPVPLTTRGSRRNFRIEGSDLAEAEESPSAYFFTVAPGYLETLEVPLVAGRDFAATDDGASPEVAIVNQAAVARYFEGEGALGRRIQLSSSEGGESWIEIVGIAGNVAHMDDRMPNPPQIYLPFEQRPIAGMTLVVRSQGDPGALVEPLRGYVQALDSREIIESARTLEDLRREVFASSDAIIALFVIFAGFALVMASMGIYGVMSYAVSQRERELGIRMALGADRAAVLKMVVAQGSKLVALGSGIGLVGAMLLSRVLASAVPGGRLDYPGTYLSVTAALVLIAVVANFAPALRATRVDPNATLRAE